MYNNAIKQRKTCAENAENVTMRSKAVNSVNVCGN